MTNGRRFRCRFCGVALRAWFPVPGEPDGAMLLNHVAQAHVSEVRRFLDQVHPTTTSRRSSCTPSTRSISLERRCGEVTRGPET